MDASPPLYALFRNEIPRFSPGYRTVEGTALNFVVDVARGKYSGLSPPVGAPPILGQDWLNSTTSLVPWNLFDGTEYVPIGWLDTVNHVWNPVGMLQQTLAIKQSSFVYLPTGPQTVFSGIDSLGNLLLCNPATDLILVYVNGAKLVNSVDFSAVTNQITLLNGALNVGDVLEVVDIVPTASFATPGVQSWNNRTGFVTMNSTDITNAGGALLASPAFTGTPTAPTQAPGTNNTDLATTAFVQNAIATSPYGVTSWNGRTGAVTLTLADITGAGGAAASSPVLVGNPTAPTPPFNNNSTSIATTAWFMGQAYTGAPLMDGAASAGSSLNWARGDHVHPSDTSRLSMSQADGRYLQLSGGQVSGSLTVLNDVFLGGSGSQFYMVLNGAVAVINFAYNWSFTANIGPGDLSFNTPNGSIWLMRHDGFSYNALGAVGGNGAYQNISDARAKAEIADSELGLDAVLGLRPRTFRRRLAGGELGKTEFGFVAQDVEGVLPEAVTATGALLPGESTPQADPMRSMSLDPIVAALVNAVKSLADRLDALEDRL